MKNALHIKHITIICALMCANTSLIFISGCSKNCQGPAGDECSNHNNNETDCITARCHYDDATNLCQKGGLEPTDDLCAYLGENECKASGDCTYYADSKTCKDAGPSIRGTCAAYQLQLACDNDIKCEWNEKELPACRTKSTN